MSLDEDGSRTSIDRYSYDLLSIFYHSKIIEVYIIRVYRRTNVSFISHPCTLTLIYIYPLYRKEFFYVS